MVGEFPGFPGLLGRRLGVAPGGGIGAPLDPLWGS